jgi:hypothetical protein
MIFNIDDNIYIIDNNNNKSFENSEFKQNEFKITIKLFTSDEFENIKKECTSWLRKFDNLKFSSKIFQLCVINWDISDENGYPILCDEKNKKIIDEKYPTFSSRVSDAILHIYLNKIRNINENNNLKQKEIVKNLINIKDLNLVIYSYAENIIDNNEEEAIKKCCDIINKKIEKENLTYGIKNSIEINKYIFENRNMIEVSIKVSE